MIHILNENEDNIIVFGKYFQGPFGERRSPIKWRVLNVTNNHVLVISQYVLECKSYQNMSGRNGFERKASVSWENCSLRKWLNTEFYQTAFSKEERRKICYSATRNKSNPQYGTLGGYDTKDSIFLLSIEEARLYCNTNRNRRSKATDFAKKKGVKTDYIMGEEQCLWWWLRSPGDSSVTVAYMLDNNIDLNGKKYNCRNVGVRPAMRIQL